MTIRMLSSISILLVSEAVTTHWEPNLIISEPVHVIGEGEYNLNSLKEINVTNSYIGLHKDIRGCQNDEPYANCTTTQNIDTILEECGCLPLNMRLSEVHWHKIKIISNLLKHILSRVNCVQPWTLTVWTISMKLILLTALNPAQVLS